MDVTKLYDEDFLLWTEQQAHALRQLDGSDSLDIVHLAEEIEDLGRRDLREVESLIEQILWHALKLVADPKDDAARHGAAELTGFQSLRRAFTPSMRRKVKLDELWDDATRRFWNEQRPNGQRDPTVISKVWGSPVSLDDLTAPSFSIDRCLAMIRGNDVAGLAAPA